MLYNCFFAVDCSRSSTAIHTEPVLVENTLARYFSGLKLSIKFPFVNSSSYSWTHNGLIVAQNTIYNIFSSCVNNIENGFRMTCQKVSCERSTYIISSLTLMFPLNRDVSFAVIEVGRNTTQLASVDVKVKGKLINV